MVFFIVKLKTYPYSHLPMQPGDILYSPIGRSIYFVGHTVIIGTDLHIKESLPSRPSGNSLSIEAFWGRHNAGDTITLLRATEGWVTAAKWATDHVGDVKEYHLGNYNIDHLAKNYCSKFVVQAYYHGANIKLASKINRFITPQYLRRSPNLKRIALFKC